MTDANAQSIQRFGDVLKATEILSRPDVKTYQSVQLRRLLRHAVETVPAWRDRADLRALAAIPDGMPFDWERWRSLPVLDRSAAATDPKSYLSQRPPPAAGRVTEAATSGSTGSPLQFWQTGSLQSVGVAVSERVARWWRLDPRRTMMRIEATERGRRRWDDRDQAADRPLQGWNSRDARGRLFIFDTTEAQPTLLAGLRRVRPDYLAAYSGILNDLARSVAPGELRLGAALSTSEVLTPAARARIASAFRCEVIDLYGATETGPLATECPHCRALHLAAETTLVEILDETGRPCLPGETGRVVITPFYNYASVLLRYEIGDMAEVSDRSCRIGLPAVTRVLGRYRNMMDLPDGSRIWPDLSDFKDFVSYRQMRLVQWSANELEMLCVPEGDREHDLAGLSAHIATYFHHGMRIRITPVETIARSASGKFEDFINHAAQ